MISFKLYIRRNILSLISVYLLFITGVYISAKAYYTTDIFIVNTSIWSISAIRFAVITYLTYAASFTSINLISNFILAVYMGACFGSYAILIFQNPSFISIVCLIMSAVLYLPGVLSLCMIDFESRIRNNKIKRLNYILSFILIFISKLFLIY